MGLTHNINTNIKTALTALTALAAAAAADPVVISGRDVPRLLGKPVASIVVVNKNGTAIPFQIDEITKDGEYVLDKGEAQNAKDGNGVLDEQDEIAFLWDDADVVGDVIPNNISTNNTRNSGINNNNSGVDTSINTIINKNISTNNTGNNIRTNNSGINTSVNTIINTNSGVDTSINTIINKNSGIDTSINTIINKNISTNKSGNNIRTNNSGVNTTIVLTRGKEKRSVTIVYDPASSLPRSPKSYVSYNHATGRVLTDYYYADFAKDRFHFVRAGVRDFAAGKYVDLTDELRVEILLKTLFGLLPIRYGEGDIYCFVRRYKAGPVRLIRRGDFHLNLGLGMKGSRAAVNQICYPRVVKVPVYVNLPIRFRTLFGQAHVEMTPVIREAGRGYVFAAPSSGLSFPAGGGALDTLCGAMPLRRMFTFKSGASGYGWILDATTPPEHISGSGFVMRRPPSRGTGVAECGFRLTVRDVPRGNYYITNWVFFSGGKAGDIERLGKGLMEPVTVVEEKGH